MKIWLTLLGAFYLVTVPTTAEVRYKDMGCSPTVANPCNGGSSSGDNTHSSPSYDYEAERQRQEAEKAAEIERQRKADEARRAREAEFIRKRDEAANLLKGLPNSGESGLKGASSNNPHGLKGLEDPGRQLKSVEQHGRQATAQDNDTNRSEAMKGFDTSGKQSGGLVYVDKQNSSAWASVLARKVPEGVRNDPQIQRLVTQHHQFELNEKRIESAIAKLKDQQKTNPDTLVEVKLKQYQNELTKNKSDKAVLEKQTKKRVVDLGFTFEEDSSKSEGKPKQ